MPARSSTPIATGRSPGSRSGSLIGISPSASRAAPPAAASPRQNIFPRRRGGGPPRAARDPLRSMELLREAAGVVPEPSAEFWAEQKKNLLERGDRPAIAARPPVERHRLPSPFCARESGGWGR